MAPFGLKLWENAFQTIPDISFFDAEKKMTIMFDKNVRRKNFQPENLQTACFAGAMVFWTSQADASRKMTPDEIMFGSLRIFAEG